MTVAFTHLRSHTEYSITESTLRIQQLIEAAKKDGQPAVAMTDIDGLFGAIRFYEAARKEGLKPIIGVDIQLALSTDHTEQPTRRVVLIAQNYDGYLKLMRLITKAYTYNLINDKPVIQSSWIQSENADHLYCLSGDDQGYLGAPLLDLNPELARTNAQTLSQLFPQRFFVEVQRRGIPEESAYVQNVVQLADDLQLPLVATHPIQFMNQEDYVAHEVKVCDAEKKILHDRSRERRFTPYQHFMTADQMHELFQDLPDALTNTQQLATSCSLNIPLGHPTLPDFQTGTSENLHEFFFRSSREGLERRLAKLYPNPQERAQHQSAYTQRLETELTQIQKMGFEGYFTIVYDFIRWSHENDIPVGPGRGSGAGSLVAYALGITDIDPLRYNLLFERFLNPERVSMPDFDIDFCIEKRDLVIDYVTRKYGADAVAGITAIGTLGCRAAILAAGRALGVPHPVVTGISKLVPNVLDITIDAALEQSSDFLERYETEPEIKKLIDYAKNLEGLPKSVGRHAAGIVIARGIIADYAPVYVPSAIATDLNEKGETVLVGNTKITTQYDKDDLEKAGLVKFDFLGLKNLTMINKTVKMIQELPGHEHFDLASIPLDDPEVFAMFRKGDTQAVFQFESNFMRDILKQAQPERIEDIIAVNALGRPGPMDLIPEYIQNKTNPSQIVYPDPRMKAILDETYGIMVYQEQVMQIAQVIGGYTLGGADLLRRAMGKKKPEEMAKHRQIFSEGAQKNGLSAEAADELFTHMEKFAGYGFNKSHAAAYSVLAYQTAYLKVKYPSAFYSAVLSVESVEKVEQVPFLIADAQNKGIKILPPDINLSHSHFSLDPHQPLMIRYGLSGLKGIGQGAVNQMLNARQQYGDFTSLADFITKCSKAIPPLGVNQINKTVTERLIMAGAFDRFHPNRAESLAAYPLIVKYNSDVEKRLARIESKKAPSALPDAIMLPMPESTESTGPESTESTPARRRRVVPKKQPKEQTLPPEIPLYQWPENVQLSLMEILENEKKAFGFYFSDHPMSYYKKQLGGLKTTETILELQEAYPSYDELHLVAGVVSELKTFDTSKGKMAKVQISDGKESLEVVIFGEIYALCKDWLKADSFALMTIQVREDKFKGGNSYQATVVRSVQQAQMYLPDTLHVSIPEEKTAALVQLCQNSQQQPITPLSTETPLPVTLWHPVNNKHELSKEAPFSVHLTPVLLDQIKKDFGPNVKLGYPEHLKHVPVVSNYSKKRNPKNKL